MNAPSRRASAVLLAAVLLTACSMRSPLTGVGSVLPAVSADTALGTTAAGSLTSLPLIAFAVASGAVPRAAGRLGVQPTVVAALLLLVAGAALRWVPGAAPLLAGTALIGVAIAVTNVLLPVVVRTCFGAHLALVTSGYLVVMQLAGGVASGTVVPLSGQLPGGWRTALAVWALPALAAAALWVPLLRARPVGAATGRRAPAPWRSPLAWAVTANMGAQSLVFFCLLTWLPTLLRERVGLGAVAAGWQLTLLQAAGVTASLVVPVLARGPRGTRRTMVGAAVAELSGVVLLLTATGGAAAVLATAGVVLAGLGGGAALVLALAATASRAADASGAVALSGMAQSVGYLLAAAGPVLVGALQVATGSWTVPLLLVAAAAAGQAVVARRAGADEVVRTA
ncbi:MFS transporter [Paenibacillus sp. TRM 82003]|uniref:MFS transporter n=1 Tax=Kineococcus sp. TRM81007 TaxID=2925831 RepID=UPI001F57CAEA|nr:MFS transporter [Kineococcus sp. TRM81007]MCI2236895.1 MFS transporter [Kineococcus sp. TRM81007]MCI3921887.1 MFS transporter [Paenibacillus sp. TRM 82003]